MISISSNHVGGYSPTVSMWIENTTMEASSKNASWCSFKCDLILLCIFLEVYALLFDDEGLVLDLCPDGADVFADYANEDELH